MKILLGQLVSFGDCLYATALARQIKKDHPQSHLTWAIANQFQSLLINNPHVDDIWVINTGLRDQWSDDWYTFEKLAQDRLRARFFDRIYLSQVVPGNLRYFDGTLRSSLFRSYDKRMTVPLSPVIRLTEEEVINTRAFIKNSGIFDFERRILVETAPQSGQSNMNFDQALLMAKKICRTHKNTCFVFSSNKKFNSDSPQIIDASGLTFRENADLINHCDLLIGASSGITWLSTSEYCKKIPTINLLSKSTGFYASMIYDHEYFGMAHDHVIEFQDAHPEFVSDCVIKFLNGNFREMKSVNKKLPLRFDYYLGAMGSLARQGKIIDLASSLLFTGTRFKLQSWKLARDAVRLIFKKFQ